MVQLALARGARVIAAVGGAEKAEVCGSLGAEVVDHSTHDVVAEVGVLTSGQGVDVILDPVQGPDAPRLRSVLRPNGRHVLCGHAGGLIPHDPDFYLFNHTLVGLTLGGYPRDEMRRITEETHAGLVALVAEGRYRPTVSRTVPFADVPEALTDLAERRTIGRLVVDIHA
jgi:NADPH2:quinone reductase